MPSTYSNLKIQLMATGENNTTWGNVTNVNLGTALEEAIVGSADVAFSNANVTLTLTDTNSTQSARNMRLNLTGTATAGYNLVVPAIEKPYIVNNGTDGTITVKNTTGTGIAIPAGKTMWVFNNGTNVVDVVTHLSSVTLGSALPVVSGGTGSNAASGARTNLGATTLGSNIFIIPNPSAVTFPRFNADNTVSALDAASFRTAIGAGSGGGSVLSVDASGGTTGMTFSGGPITTSGTLTLAGTLAVANGGTGVTTSTGTGSVVLSASPSFTGTVNFGPAIVTGSGVSTGDAQLELGGNRSGDGLAYIDLHAQAGTDFQSRLVRYGGANGGMDLIQTGTGGMAISNEGSADTVFKTSALERMRITNAGNVGIGTASPGAKLDVAGGNIQVANNQNMQFRNFAGTGTANFTLQNDDNFVVTNAAGTPIQSFTQAANAFAVYGGNANNRMIVDSGSNIVYWNVNGSERMRIASNGFVGVGTSTDNGVDKLTVAGVVGSYVSGRAGFHLYNGGATAEWFIGQPSGAIHNLTFSKLVAGTYTDYVAITSAGNVGIGTASPLYQATVFGLGQETAALTDAGNKGGSLYLQATGVTGGSGGALLFGTTFGNQTPFAAIKGLVTDGSTNTIGDLAISTRNAIADTALSERIRINSAGNIGIGTSSPGYRLDVASGDTSAGLGYAMRIRSNATAAAATLQFTTSTVSTQNGIIACSDTGAMTIQTDGASSVLAFRTNGSERLRILNTGGITSGDLADAVGYKGVPQNSQTASYTLALSDMGKHISITTGGVVIPANGSVAFPVGSTIVIYNNSGTAQNISITTDTLRLAGTATTGTRSLAQRGLATCVKVASTEWVVSGNVT